MAPPLGSARAIREKPLGPWNAFPNRISMWVRSDSSSQPLGAQQMFCPNNIGWLQDERTAGSMKMSVFPLLLPSALSTGWQVGMDSGSKPPTPFSSAHCTFPWGVPQGCSSQASQLVCLVQNGFLLLSEAAKNLSSGFWRIWLWNPALLLTSCGASHKLLYFPDLPVKWV